MAKTDIFKNTLGLADWIWLSIIGGVVLLLLLLLLCCICCYKRAKRKGRHQALMEQEEGNYPLPAQPIAQQSVASLQQQNFTNNTNHLQEPTKQPSYSTLPQHHNYAQQSSSNNPDVDHYGGIGYQKNKSLSPQASYKKMGSPVMKHQVSAAAAVGGGGRYAPSESSNATSDGSTSLQDRIKELRSRNSMAADDGSIVAAAAAGAAVGIAGARSVSNETTPTASNSDQQSQNRGSYADSYADSYTNSYADSTIGPSSFISAPSNRRDESPVDNSEYLNSVAIDSPIKVNVNVSDALTLDGKSSSGQFEDAEDNYDDALNKSFTSVNSVEF